jgi:DnaA-homolog protein
MKGAQLPLGVQLAETASFDSFFAGPNAEAVVALQDAIAATAPPLTLVFGPAQSGRSHLLQALTRLAAALSLPCAYVPLAQLAREATTHAIPDAAEALAGLDKLELVCLDDVDAVAARPEWTVGLVRLLDAVRANGGRCVASATAPPERWEAVLSDLRTRLAAAAIYGLKPLDDDDRVQLLRDRARARGLELPPDAAQLLLSRLPRDAGTLVAAVSQLDTALLSAQRRLTVAFVQQWLKDNPQASPPG